MASNMVVPSSRHTLFMRGFRGETDMDKIRDYFTKEGGRCTFDFFKHSDDRATLCVALRFDSKDVAKEVLNRYDSTVVLGSKIYITWFKDHRRARAKAEESWRSNRQSGGYRFNTVQNRSRYNNWGRRTSRKTRSSSRSSSRSRSRSKNRSRSNTRSHTWSRSRSRSNERSMSNDGKDRDNSPEIRDNKRGSYDKSPERGRSGNRYRSYQDDEQQFAEGRDRTPAEHRGDRESADVYRRNSDRYDDQDTNKNRYRSQDDSPAEQDRRYGESYTKYEDPLANSRWADNKSPSHSPSPRRSVSRDRVSPDSRKQKSSKYEEKASPEWQMQSSDRNSDRKRNSRYDSYDRSHGEDDGHERTVMIAKTSSQNRSPQNASSASGDRELKRSSSPRRRNQNTGQWDSSPETEGLVPYPLKTVSKQTEADRGASFSSLPHSDDHTHKIGGSINMTLKSSKSSLQKSALDGSDSEREPVGKYSREGRSSNGRRDMEAQYADGEGRHAKVATEKSSSHDVTDIQMETDMGKPTNERSDNKSKGLFEKYKASMRTPSSSYSKKDASGLAGGRGEEDEERKHLARLDLHDDTQIEYMEASPRPKKRKDQQEEGHAERSKESSKSSGRKSKRRSREFSESSQCSETPEKNHADPRMSKPDGDRNAPSDSNPSRLMFDLSQLGLDAATWKKVQDKKHKVEKAYRQDCETFATVVKMLISKDPSLEDKLQHSLKENLEEIGQRCIHEMKAFIEQCKKVDSAV